MARDPHHGHHDGEDASVNLIPIMSILVILIPVLLFSFTFFEVKVQAVSSPRMGGCCVRPDAPKPLGLTVLMTERGFVIRHRDAPAMAPIPLREGEAEARDPYDYAALYNALVEVKARYPDASAIQVGGAERVPWRLLSRTLDAVRTRLADDRYDSVLSWSQAPVRVDAEGAPVALFDQISLAVAE